MPRLLGNRPTTALGLTLFALLPSAAIHARTVPCNPVDQAAISAAISFIEQGLDPCGDTEEVLELLDKVRHSPAIYRICTDPRADRNSFDRAPAQDGNLSRTITWNPRLHDELEPGCDGDPHKPVLRDPGASLLHELAHAAQDADGLDPGEHEMDAVRIENIYRRAAGLCQRAHYGSDPLPPQMIRVCNPSSCGCTLPGSVSRPPLVSMPPGHKVSRKDPMAHAGGNAAVIRSSDSGRR